MEVLYMIMIAKKVQGQHCGLEYLGLEGVAPFVPPQNWITKQLYSS